MKYRLGIDVLKADVEKLCQRIITDNKLTAEQKNDNLADLYATMVDLITNYGDNLH